MDAFDSLTTNIVNGYISKESFDCGNASINDLVYASPFLTLLKFAVSYEIINDGSIVGYYMIDFKELRLDDCPESVREYNDGNTESCAVARIRYIAIKKEKQGLGFGTYTLKAIVAAILEMSKELPIRLIVLDALKERCSWYEERGFFYYNEKEKETSSSATVRMYMDCIPDIESLFDVSDIEF